MASGDTIKVWDIAIRIFHWSLVILFFVAYASGEEESALHVYSGYGIIGLLIFRLFWGVFGPKYSRFGNFIYGPVATIRYIQSLFSARPYYYIGHNPVGGWMIVALLLALVAVSWSGLELYATEGRGPLAGFAAKIVSPTMADDDRDKDRDKGGDEKGEELWEELHEFFANSTLLLIFLHVIGVLLSSMVHGENLIKSMITGYKKKR
jgi:cytochrome b